MAATNREFVRMLLESDLQESILKNFAVYLKQEQERIDKLIASPETRAVDKNEYENEKKILNMEEKLLYELVNYLQKIGFLKTNQEDLSDRSSRTTDAHNEPT